MIGLAADSCDVSAICLSQEPPGTVQTDLVPGGMTLVRVAKTGVQPVRLLFDTLRTGRSLTHARFDSDALVAAISAATADVFVAPGVTIGDGAVVTARSSVFHDIEPWTVVSGNPACFVKLRRLMPIPMTRAG